MEKVKKSRALECDSYGTKILELNIITVTAVTVKSVTREAVLSPAFLKS